MRASTRYENSEIVQMHMKSQNKEKEGIVYGCIELALDGAKGITE